MVIDYCIGTVQSIHDQEIIVDTGFFGIKFQIPRSHSFTHKEQVKIYVYMHWSAENGPNFYGFSSSAERSVFCVIISCSGVGPKIGLSILSELGVESFLHAIQNENEQTLSKVHGVGKKKAEQIIVALKHKVAALLESGSIELNSQSSSIHIHDVSQALQSLNYSRTEIANALDYVRKNIKAPDATFDYLLRQALMYLSKQI